MYAGTIGTKSMGSTLVQYGPNLFPIATDFTNLTCICAFVRLCVWFRVGALPYQAAFVHVLAYHGTVPWYGLGHFTTVLVHVPDENGEHGGPSLRGPSSAASGPLELRDINYESHTPLVY